MKLIKVTDFGDHVECDICGKGWTGNTDISQNGGFLLGSKGICPDCAPRMKADLEHYGESHYIKDFQRQDESFAQACMRWRGGNNEIRIYADEPNDPRP